MRSGLLQREAQRLLPPLRGLQASTSPIPPASPPPACRGPQRLISFPGTVPATNISSCGGGSVINGTRIYGNVPLNILRQSGCNTMSLLTWRASFSSEANEVIDEPTETVKEHYQNMLKSIEARTMPPNAWLWSLVKCCANKEDIKLLFQILHRLRIFRLSNLRIHANFNCHLCMRVSEACARAGSLDYGMKTLWKHNVYGLTPSIGSAHYLLLYAKEHKELRLMIEIMEILQKNSLPLQPGTADIVFSICYSKNRWNLISNYAKKFLKAGVKLHRTAYDIWIEFAAKIGDAQSIWKIEKLRSKHVKTTTLASGFSCAKGYLLERNPTNAATSIHLLYQDLPDKKKQSFTEELQKLVRDWPLEVVKWKKNEERKALAEFLKEDVNMMISQLVNTCHDIQVNLEELQC